MNETLLFLAIVYGAYLCVTGALLMIAVAFDAETYSEEGKP